VKGVSEDIPKLICVLKGRQEKPSRRNPGGKTETLVLVSNVAAFPLTAVNLKRSLRVVLMPAPSLLLGIAFGLVHGLAVVGLNPQIHGMESSGGEVLYPLQQLLS